MKTYVSSQPAMVWAILVLVTLGTWEVSAHGSGYVAVAAILVLIAAKIVLVGLHFMDIRHAPRDFAVAFVAFIVVLVAVLACLYRLWLY